MNQKDTSKVRFMVEGFWPSQEVYDQIHDLPVYKERREDDNQDLVGLVTVEYHRFKIVK